MKLKKAKRLAKKYSADCRIEFAAVTKARILANGKLDYSVVTTLTCTNYQWSQDNVLRFYYKGNRVKP